MVSKLLAKSKEEASNPCQGARFRFWNFDEVSHSVSWIAWLRHQQATRISAAVTTTSPVDNSLQNLGLLNPTIHAFSEHGT